MSRIAIVMVNYRNAEDTIACLDSIEKAGGAGFRIFVIENASGDGSAGKLVNYLKDVKLNCQLLVMESNIGFASGCNAGIRAALGEGCSHILLLNNDTLVSPDFGAGVLEAAEGNPDSVVAGFISDLGTGRPAQNHGRISRFTFLIEFDFSERPGPIKPIDFVSGCMMLVPVAVFTKIGFLKDDFFLYCEDLEFCLRMKKHGIALKYASCLAVEHRVSSSVTKTNFPKEYYRMRNHTYAVLKMANPLQKFIYALRVAGVLVKRRGDRRLFREFRLGLADALNGRLGYRGDLAE